MLQARQSYLHDRDLASEACSLYPHSTEALSRHCEGLEGTQSSGLFCCCFVLTPAVREGSHVLPHSADLDEDIPSPGQSTPKESSKAVVSPCCFYLFSAVSKLVFSLGSSKALYS